MRAYLASWLEGKRGTLRSKTLSTYQHKIDLLLPEIGHQKLAKLQPSHLREAYANIARKVSGTTVHHCHGVIRSALKDALREGLVARDVGSLVTAPRRSTSEQRYLRVDEAGALLEALQGENLEAFFTTALLTGLRLGELQALRWRDVDLERRRLVVARTFTEMRDGEPVFEMSSSRKNHARTVWLAERVVDALERWRADQEAAKRKARDAWHEYGLIFTSRVGTPLDTYHVSQRHLPRILKKAELDHIRFHDLRHTAGTIWLSQGVPVKVVSEMLGHSDVTTTLRVYAHVVEGSQQQAVDLMDRLFHA
jgi:integrase